MNPRFPILFCLVVFCLVSVEVPLGAEEGKAWMRYPAISHDGQSIAFSFQGDIWVVPRSGGEARRLTTHAGYERSPVWSPDDQHIAFMADWHGNGDVFLVGVDGGTAKRLTWHSASDVPTSFTPDGSEVLFTSGRLDAPQAAIGTSAMTELYAVSVEGGRPRQVLTTPAHRASMDSAGKRLVFHDFKGFEDEFRKHHTSSVTRDIWMFDLESGNYTRLSGFAGEDRSPVFSPDGQSVFYLSEQVEAQAVGESGKNEPPQPEGDQFGRVIPQLDSSFNVWQLDLADPGSQKKITEHDTHPVRFLTIAKDGTLCYSYNGEIWVKPADGDSAKVDVQLSMSLRTNPAERETMRNGATEMAVAPNEEEVAFVVRGEVFVANVEFGTTRRITETPTQERSVCWGKDSRTLYYAGERKGSWNLYKTEMARDDEPGFAYATVLKETPLLESDDETFQPVCSPDGKKLAYLKNRTELMVLDLDTGQSSTVVPGQLNFSYSDGDISYDWSPDSRWLVLTYQGHRSLIGEIGAVELATGKIVNITESGYGEGRPQFASNGSALLYSSDRYGERSHGSWGGENDVLAVYLNQAAFDKATLSKEELALKKKQEEKAKPEKDQPSKDGDAKQKTGEKTESGDEDADDDSDDKIEPIDFNTEDLELRTRRLTLHSSSLGGFDLSPDGENLLYIAQVDDKWGLWLTKVRDRSTANVMDLSGDGNVEFTKDGNGAFLIQGEGQISKVDLAGALKGGGKASAKPVGYAAEMEIQGDAERAYVFEHAWRQVKRKFYDENLHGVDWEAMKANYAQFLPTINNNYDFAELLSELLGELNASHTGCGYRPSMPDGDQTAALGLLYDVGYDGVGLKVAEVIDRGPFDNAETKVKAGDTITHVNGQRLTPDVNPWKLLNRKAGKPIRLTFNSEEGDEWEETVRPISIGAEGNLLYERWIANRRKLCEELSEGRVGYVHVRGMNDGSFRRVYSEVLGRNNEKEALIVDTRFNGGGWLHEDLATFLSGKSYVQFAPRGHEKGTLGGEPTGKWTKPVVVLQSESNYSDAHFFPWAFKEKGVGKLIGAPVPGTATAVWWEPQINPALVFGIPQVGMITNDGEYLENNQLEPDVLVLNEPPDVAKGDDPQLKTAVEELLKMVDGK